MNEFAILAASYLGAEGWGNDQTGLRSWPAPLSEALQRGELEALRWSTLFPSETSRFGRMDGLSRLGLMAVELLDAGFAEMDPAQRDSVGVCVETRSGSLATDLRFLHLPTAGTFAYTLPSTVLGEICIRHGFRGPVMCLLPGAGGQGGALDVAPGWLARGEAEACACVGCDLADREAATRPAWPDDPPPGGWRGYAVLIGKRAGRVREYPGYSGSLAGLARSLCLERTESK